MSCVSSVIAIAAQVLPFLPVLAAVVVWLLASRSKKKQLAVLAITAAVLATVFIYVAGAVHEDPRPFVADPSRPPLFPHSADNGFPSDHTVYAATAALLVLTVRRRLGAALVVVAAVGGLGRVAANVHHVQDIAAALIIAALAVHAALFLTAWSRRATDRRLQRAEVKASGGTAQAEAVHREPGSAD